jgi:hypothetical protein
VTLWPIGPEKDEPGMNAPGFFPLIGTNRETLKRRLEHVLAVADCDYSIQATASDVDFQSAGKNITVQPGKTIDLGNIKLQRRR